MENKNNANYKNNMPKDAVAHLRENPTAPVRILVSTATHLVPGDGYFARTEFMQNLISQYHWNRDFEWGRDRFEAYNAEFGYDNRTCYFLIDYGQSPGGDDGVVPILWYRWTGELLIPIHEALPSQIRKRLKKFPFTRPKPTPRTEPRQISATERRENIRAQLRHDMGLSDKDFKFLKESSEHTIWLEQNIEAKFWSKFKSLEAEWEEFQKKVACGKIKIKMKIPKDCTEMWDCECSLCSS